MTSRIQTRWITADKHDWIVSLSLSTHAIYLPLRHCRRKIRVGQG